MDRTRQHRRAPSGDLEAALPPGARPAVDRAELARLRLENAELRAGVDARTQENALLVRMIADVISTVKLDQVLGRIVEHLVAGIGCHDAFIYLWDVPLQRLVLRAASERYRRHIGRISMGLGEGLAGWSAATRTPVMLGERALDDPRFRYFPELEEELFQAILTVPLTGADGSVVAVINLHTVAPQEFTAQHVRLVEAVAPLLGGAIETSEIYENTTRKLAVLSTLSALAPAVRSGRSLDEALHALAETTVRVTASDLCALVLAEPGLSRLSVRAYRRQTGDATTTVAALPPGSVERRPWDQLAARVSPASLGLSVGSAPPMTGASGPSGGGPSVGMSAPLVATGEQLGLILCYRATPRPYADDDTALLNIIANQTAIAIKNSQLADLLDERDVPARLFHDLEQGAGDDEELIWRRAALLGCDLARPHAPIVLDVAGGVAPGNERKLAYESVAVALRRWLTGAHFGSLVHAADAEALALVRLPHDDTGGGPTDDLDAALAAVEQETGLRLVAGVGGACQAPHAYRRGFAEAREALRVARALSEGGHGQHGTAVHFDRLGALRYLSRLPVTSGDDLPDRYQESVERVAGYDARKRMALLETLETYLTCGGNIARASERLYVHRNTLVQRLEKLHELLGFDPRDSDHWLALHVALTLRRFQHGTEPGPSS